jgi:hypothetical protein
MDAGRLKPWAWCVAVGKAPVDHLLAPFSQLVSMSRTSSSFALGRVSYGDFASKSECPRQQVLGVEGAWLGCIVRQPKNSSKCKRGAGTTTDSVWRLDCGD